MEKNRTTESGDSYLLKMGAYLSVSNIPMNDRWISNPHNGAFGTMVVTLWRTGEQRQGRLSAVAVDFRNVLRISHTCFDSRQQVDHRGREKECSLVI